MLALTVALFTATLALAGKIFFDLRGVYRARRGIAGALAGEIAAYLELLNVKTTCAGFRMLATAPADAVLKFCAAQTELPTTHPVFDKAADQIGLLPHAEAEDISRVYNIVTGFRLLLSSMSSPGFLAAGEAVQKSRINFMLEALEREEPKALDLVVRLKRIAQQSVWYFIGNLCWLHRASGHARV
jgi:hypothetical protein